MKDQTMTFNSIQAALVVVGMLAASGKKSEAVETNSGQFVVVLTK
jgi:hypothetical protein